MTPRAQPPRASILIPAHQEELVIGRCLGALLSTAAPGEFEILVVANGCTDETASVARSYGAAVEVLALPEGSKSMALNAGDAVLRHYPRLYLDADIEMPTHTARALADALGVKAPRLAAPTRRLQLDGVPPLVKRYFTTWEALQRARGESIGSGVYALNNAARARFSEFPPGIGDDIFIHNLFPVRERILIPEAVSVWPPSDTKELVAVRTRVAVGNKLAPSGPGFKDRPSLLRQLYTFARDPKAIAGAPIYACVTALSKVQSRRRIRQGDQRWSRARRSV